MARWIAPPTSMSERTPTQMFEWSEKGMSWVEREPNDKDSNYRQTH